MAMSREAKRSRLERAGFRHVSGWVPEAYAAKVAYQVEAYREDVAKILAQPPKPRGRPRKEG